MPFFRHGSNQGNTLAGKVGLVQNRRCSGDITGGRRAPGQRDFPTRTPVAVGVPLRPARTPGATDATARVRKCQFGAGLCQISPQRLGPKCQPGPAPSTEHVDLTGFRNGAYGVKPMPGPRVNRRAKKWHKMALGSRFFEWLSARSRCGQVIQSMVSEWFTTFYDAQPPPRGVPFLVIQCHFCAISVPFIPERTPVGAPRRRQAARACHA
jgi:hypothetical protein